MGDHARSGAPTAHQQSNDEVIPKSLPLLCLAGIATLAAVPASAQTPTAKLVGFAYDSINAGPLAGAMVLVSGTPRMGMADSTGRFFVDSIPVGEYQLAVFHPLLDSLGVGVATRPIRFGPDSTQVVMLGTPSPESVLRNRCPAASAMLGPSAIVGRVVDAETGEGIDGARASLAWEAEPEFGTTRRRPTLRVAQTNTAGEYVICGLPAVLDGTLQVEHGPLRSPEFPVTFADELLKIRGVSLARQAVAGAARGTATVTGMVVDLEGRGAASVTVSLEGAGVTTTTDSTGAFTLASLPAGSWVLRARRIGHQPADTAIELASGSRTQVRLRLGERMTELSAVVVEEERISPGLAKLGFAERERMGMGRFLTSHDIARRGIFRTSDIFQGIAGIQVVPDGRGGFTLQGRGSGSSNCVSVFIDGFYSPEATQDLDRTLPPEHVAGVEVYTGSNTPDQFSAPGRRECATVVLWSKSRARER